MNGRRLGVAAAVAAVSSMIALSVEPVAGQAKSGVPRDPHGRPDLQGIWTSNEMAGVPPRVSAYSESRIRPPPKLTWTSTTIAVSR